MPIRFRCPTCAGLMSIARRKANTVVSCPKCGEQVIVPVVEPAAVAIATSNSSTADRPLFERNDFDSLLSNAGVTSQPTPAKPVDSKPIPLPVPESDFITLSYPAVAMLGAGCFALVVASFAAGYLSK